MTYKGMRYIFIGLIVTVLSGCITFLGSTNIKSHEDFGKPTSLNEFLAEAEKKFGKNNILTFENGNIIDVYVNSIKNAYHTSAALSWLCDRVTGNPRDQRTGRPHTSNASSSESVYATRKGGFLIPVAQHFRSAREKASSHYEPDYYLSGIDNRPSHHCRDYQKQKMVSIPFGWEVVVRGKKGEKLTDMHHLIIVRTAYYDSFLAKYENNFDEYMAEATKKVREQIETRKRREEDREQREKQLTVERQQIKERQREATRDLVARADNIGKRICKDGILTYQHYLGYTVMGEPRTKNMSEPGQIVAQLESITSDRYRIQFRILNFGTPTSKLQVSATDAPFMDEFQVKPGNIYWDDIEGWFVCAR